MSDNKSDDHISIRFEIDIPVGVNVGVRDSRRRRIPESVPTSTVPAAGTVHDVRPTTTSALGTICARANFPDPAFEVRAKNYIPPDANPPATPPPSALLGTASADTREWSWSDANSNAIPGVDHIPPAGAGTVFPANLLMIWTKETSGSDWDPLGVQFMGRTGTSGYCGTGSGSNGFVGFQGALFPAVWAVQMSGFSGGEATFNALHALRSDRSAGVPTWHNEGDGKNSLRVALRFRPDQRRWELLAEHGGHSCNAHSTCASSFGPLAFTLDKVSASKKQVAPRITATAF